MLCGGLGLVIAAIVFLGWRNSTKQWQRIFSWIAGIWAGVSIIVYAYIFIAALVSPLTSEPTLAPTEPPLPTYTPLTGSTILPTFTKRPSCTLWSMVSLSDIGRRMCVYGNIEEEFEDDMAYYIRFSKSPGDFYIVSYDWVYKDLGKGDCVSMTGEVQKLGASPVIVLEYKDRLDGCP